MNFHYSLAKGCRNTELFWKLINSRPSAGEARLAPKFGRTFLRVTKSDPLSRRARKKGRETTTGCFHRRILAVQLPPCLWENWRWLVRPVPLVVATFSSVLVWLLGNIGKVMSCFFFSCSFWGCRLYVSNCVYHGNIIFADFCSKPGLHSTSTSWMRSVFPTPKQWQLCTCWWPHCCRWCFILSHLPFTQPWEKLKKTGEPRLGWMHH